jgi:hypothetical protein
MNWEAYDYRPKKPKQPQPYLKWQVPADQARSYIWNVFMFIFLIPAILGFALTPIGIAIQVLVIDYFLWVKYKWQIND